MENLDLIVLRALLDWRRAGKKALLATVVRTWGSSPRPVGSIMALCEDGSVVGSVSGGCIEDDLIRNYSGLQHFPLDQQSAPQFLKYGVTADEAHRFGLPCGGTLEILLEFNVDIDSLAKLINELTDGKLVARETELKTGTVTLKVIAQPEALSINETVLSNTFGPEYRMLIIGAGQLSEYLATMALFNGFSVTVCDPREEYRGNWKVTGVTLSSQMPDDLVQEMRLDSRSCVVALTHDPKLDDLALLDALQTKAFYVGAIGSRRNSEARRQRMIEHFGYTEESIAKLKGPVGIYIGSKTPPEVAVSVMAEILAVKNGVRLPESSQVSYAKELL
ncbi:XdhC family protein [Polynucleobacter paneuropaeus]|uniref:XdhC family protein n=1 Tax=Polynucleobacter paneuropaeus TaxID=2527775 RepID=UPI001BFD8A73|nr:XdhC family protein [Polynucleobacter paneuropaeus]QWD53560.1 XdhC family protein [Polynucleobacter paneuropaeus]QWD58482.1 XdhC family protein [Polynucleobacter paneuropaeus]